MKQYMCVVHLMDILLGGDSAPICLCGDASLIISDILVRCLYYNQQHFCTISRPTVRYLCKCL